MKHFVSVRAQLRQRYGDYDEQQTAISVGGDAFSGTFTIHADHRAILSIPEQLAGFPKQPKDEVTFRLGEGDSAEFKFTCADAKGHILLFVLLKAAFWPPAHQELLQVCIRCDPADIDEFCNSISAFAPGVDGEAIIRGKPFGQ